MENGKILSTSNKILAIELQNKEVIPSIETQVITADEGYIGLDKVVVKPVEFAPPEKAYFFPTKFDENGYVIEAESRGIVGNLPANFLGVGTTSTSSSNDKYKNMFYDKLKVFRLNDGLRYVNGSGGSYGAFHNCTALTDIYIPSSCIENNTGFFGCSSLINIHYASLDHFFEFTCMPRGVGGYGVREGNMQYKNSYIGDELISGEIIIPSNKSVPNGCFMYDNNVTKIDFNGISFCGYRGCYKMKELIEIKNYNGKFLTSSFRGNFNLKKVNCPNSTEFWEQSFMECFALELIDFRNRTLTTVPKLESTNVFYNTNDTFKIVVPDNLYDTWITSTNWSATGIVEHIIKASDYEASL